MVFREALRKRKESQGDKNSAEPGPLSPTIAEPANEKESPRPVRQSLDPSDAARNSRESKRWSHFRSRSGGSDTSEGGKDKRSSFLGIRTHSRDKRASSVHLPSDLPDITDNPDRDDNEAQWEKRATLLVQRSPFAEGEGNGESTEDNPVESEGDLQKAIELHETGNLEESTKILSKLADPQGANNALAQVLYGLALRHGWGIDKDPTRAVNFLSRAASNSALIESAALNTGNKRGGAAKGELVLAIYELANCFRNGWGVDKDPVAARKYYETAANLGDTDAMNEAARCYEDGVGGKKDKFMAAKYYRKAEEHGNKTLGNSWIWKEKYNPKA